MGEDEYNLQVVKIKGNKKVLILTDSNGDIVNIDTNLKVKIAYYLFTNKSDYSNDKYPEWFYEFVYEINHEVINQTYAPKETTKLLYGVLAL